MRKAGSEQHYFTVRGRGFDHKQWRAVTELAAGIVRRAKEAGIAANFDGDARRIVVSSDEEGVTPLVIWRKGEPNIPKEVVTKGQYDAVIQSVLTAAKKVAPDIFEMVAWDGRDYRRLLAKQNDILKTKLRELAKDTRELKNREFMKAVKRQKWPHPETRHQVEFVSLPKTEQTKLRHQWEADYGRRFDMAAERAAHKLREAEKARTEAQRVKDKAEDAAEAFKKQKHQMQEGQAAPAARSANVMDDQAIRKAAIRVAHTTDDPELKRALLEILRPTAEGSSKEAQETSEVKEAKDKKSEEKDSRHEEGKSVDVGDYLKSKGMKEDSAKWEKHEGDIGKKATSLPPTQVVFPEIYDLAWKDVVAYTKANPESKTASGSTAQRVTAADLLAKKWIQKAIKHPGRVHEYLGIPEGKEIPMGKLDAAIEKVKGTGNKSLLSALLLAKRLKGGIGKKKAEDAETQASVVTPKNFPEIYRVAAEYVTEFLGAQSENKTAAVMPVEKQAAMAHKLAKKWISDAIKRPGRVREYLGVPEGKDIPMGKLNAAIEKVKGTGNKSLLSALLLAKRLKGGIGKKKKKAEEVAA